MGYRGFRGTLGGKLGGKLRKGGSSKRDRLVLSRQGHRTLDWPRSATRVIGGTITKLFLANGLDLLNFTGR